MWRRSPWHASCQNLGAPTSIYLHQKTFTGILSLRYTATSKFYGLTEAEIQQKWPWRAACSSQDSCAPTIILPHWQESKGVLALGCDSTLEFRELFSYLHPRLQKKINETVVQGLAKTVDANMRSPFTRYYEEESLWWFIRVPDTHLHLFCRVPHRFNKKSNKYKYKKIHKKYISLVFRFPYSSRARSCWDLLYVFYMRDELRVISRWHRVQDFFPGASCGFLCADGSIQSSSRYLSSCHVVSK